MLADLRREPTVERLALVGLSEQGVADFLENTAGHELEQEGIELAHVVHAETEGNPFFVGEVLRHLVETNAIVFRDGRWTSDLAIDQVGIPEGVREVIGRRLSHMETATNEVLTIASVVGREFDVGLLAKIAPGGEDAVLDALEAAETSGLVQSVPGRAASYRFSHALVRTTLYEELTTSRRLRLHRDVARVLADRPDADARLPELARHFSEAAALGEVDRAIEYCTRAGDAARDEVAFEEAAAYYERALGALDLADDPSELTRADLLMAQGSALSAIVDPRGHEVLTSATDVARSSGDASRFADAVLLLHDAQLGVHVDFEDGLVTVLEEALDALGAADPDRRALLLCALAMWLMWSPDLERRQALVGEALTLARQSQDRAVLAQVLYRQAFGYDHTDAAIVPRYTAEGNELVSLAGEVDDPILLFSAHEQRLLGAVMVGDRATADADLAAIEVLAERLRRPAFEARARTLRAAHLLLSGRLDDAEAAIGVLSAFEQERGLVTFGVPSLLYRLYYERGRLAEIEPLMVGLLESDPAVVVVRVALTGVYTATDRPDEARAHLELLAADDFAMLPRNNVWVASMAGVARSAALVGALDIAARALDAMLPFGHIIAGTGSSYEQPVGMSIGTAAAALGRWDEAEKLFAQALDLSERLVAPTFVAMTQVAWAQALADRGSAGDTARARELATVALATADELGLARVAELSRRVLA